MEKLIEMGKLAKKSASSLSVAFTGEKNDALFAIAKALRDNSEEILSANQKDLDKASENGLSAAMTDRLKLDYSRLDDIAKACEYIASLEDPIGKVLEGGIRPNGLHIIKTTVPLGVVGMIYEARPNVTVDCAALCIKSGNACILRGGKEAINSNMALVKVMQDALASTSIDSNAVQLIENTDRETATAMMRMREYIDVLIPRGSQGLIQAVVKDSTVPVIETGAGNCHIYVDRSAHTLMAIDIVENAKVSRPSVCNAVETLLVHKDAPPEFLPMLKKRLISSGVKLLGCEKTLERLGEPVTLATDEDYATEFDDYILTIKIVNNMDEAIEHIEKYSTHHSEAIITSDYSCSQIFTSLVNSAAVYVNASTRFTDGGEFGLGAEIGISTQKLHARGPMGISSLTSTKYIVTGNGQVRK